VYAQGVYVWGNNIDSIHVASIPEKNTLVTNDDNRIRPPVLFDWPTQLGIGNPGCLEAVGDGVFDFSLQPLIYCTYQPMEAFLGLTKNLLIFSRKE